MKRRSLSGWVALLTAGVVAAAMGAYAVYEYLVTPGATAAELLVRHAWHVAALGALVYIVTWAAVRKLVVLPMRVIGAHLYGVGTGVVDRLEHETRVEEIDALVSGVNLMVQRMRQGHDEDAVDTVQEDLFALRQLAREVHAVDPHRSSTILAHVTRLQSAMASMIRRAA